MARRRLPIRRTDECSNPSIRSKIAREAAQAAVEAFVRSPVYQDVVDKTVNSALSKLGVDIEHPEKMREDLIALRDWRETLQLVRRKGIGTIVVSIVALMMTALGIGVGVMLTRVTN